MFWSSMAHRMATGFRRRGLRFQLTVSYSLLFGGALVTVMLISYLYLQKHMLDEIDYRLRMLCEEFEQEYIVGDAPVGKKLRAKRIPPETLAVAEAYFGDNSSDVFLAVNTEANDICFFSAAADGSVKTCLVNRATLQVRQGVRYPDTGRVEHMRYAFATNSYGAGENQLFWLLLSPEREVLAQSKIRDEMKQSFCNEPLPEGTSSVGLSFFPYHDTRIRTYHFRLFDGNCFGIGYDMEDEDKRLATLLDIFLWCGAAMFVMCCVVGYWLAGRFTRGVEAVAAAARDIELGDYSKRVPCQDDYAEIACLSEAFNDMTAKTEQSLYELRTISDNIAHDLRTPLTRMRAQAEFSMLSDDANAAVELPGDICEECDRMLNLINTMLEITQLEFHKSSDLCDWFEPANELGKVMELFSTVAEDQKVHLDCECAAASHFQLFLNRAKFQQLVANLLDNAIKFTPEGGSVSLSIERRKLDGAWILRVADTGCGISEADRVHIFERFYRSDSSRSMPGNGLGLSLVEAIVKSFDGQIDVESQPGEGTVFIVTIPHHGEQTKSE